ncbi:MAG: hypothetical protein WC960_04570 [Bacteroidales bacterium]
MKGQKQQLVELQFSIDLNRGGVSFGRDPSFFITYQPIFSYLRLAIAIEQLN